MVPNKARSQQNLFTKLWLRCGTPTAMITPKIYRNKPLNCSLDWATTIKAANTLGLPSRYSQVNCYQCCLQMFSVRQPFGPQYTHCDLLFLSAFKQQVHKVWVHTWHKPFVMFAISVRWLWNTGNATNKPLAFQNTAKSSSWAKSCTMGTRDEEIKLRDTYSSSNSCVV